MAFTYDAMGGAGSSETAGPDENNVAAGFMGAALRNVDTGAYVASVRHPCTGGCSGQREQVSMESTGEAGQKYTIDVIDNYSGGWGWMLVNNFDIHQGIPPYVDVASASVNAREDSGEEFVGGRYADGSEPVIGDMCKQGGPHPCVPGCGYVA